MVLRQSTALPVGVGVDLSSWFYLLCHVRAVPPSALVDPRFPIEALQSVFHDLWAHFAQTTPLFVIDSTEFQGTSISAAARSVARAAAVRVLQAALLVLVLGMLVVVISHPATWLPRDPSSMASLAMFHSVDTAFGSLFDGTGSMSESALAEHLRGWVFCTSVKTGRSFSLTANQRHLLVAAILLCIDSLALTLSSGYSYWCYFQ